MIAHLRGTIHRLTSGEVTIEVQGVGYLISVPIDVWDSLEEGAETLLWVSTYVREDRFDLFGFLDATSRTLFRSFIEMPGIGPRLGLELCAFPRELLLQAIDQQDPSLLTSVKGIGKKTAEKLLIELKSMTEKQPDIFGTEKGKRKTGGVIDQDAIEALGSLGYDTSTILHTLKNLPKDLTSTEERVAAALRAL